MNQKTAKLLRKSVYSDKNLDDKQKRLVYRGLKKTYKTLPKGNARQLFKNAL